MSKCFTSVEQVSKLKSRSHTQRESMSNVGVISVAPREYLHVLDTNTNVTRVILGPQRFTRNESEKVVSGPNACINVPPRCYVIIENPCIKDQTTGEPVCDQYGQVTLRHGDAEVRLSDIEAGPFPLYPGEFASAVQKLRVVAKDQALRLRALRDVTVSIDGKDLKLFAGDEFMFTGPGTYLPKIEVEEVEEVKAVIIKHSQALRMRAKRFCTDSAGQTRKAGEEWLVRDSGAYLPSCDEEIIGLVEATVLTDKTALHLRALKTYVDVYHVERKAGQEWLVTSDLSDAHIVDVYEQSVKTVKVTTLSTREYCVVRDPYIDGVQRMGMELLRKGEAVFFLLPGETLKNGIEHVVVLADDQALLVQASEAYTEDESDGGVIRKPGDRWMIYGPREYTPSTQLVVLETRRSVPLDINEGIYVRDTKTGQVRAVIGETYMLKPTEELWEKELPDEVEVLLAKQALGINYITPERRSTSFSYNDSDEDIVAQAGIVPAAPKPRDRTRVVTFRVSENAAVQVYDYKSKKARVIFGPDVVILMPDEQFSVVRLSGDKPKRPNVIITLSLSLGPDFMTDRFHVETCDHARLSLTLSYNWHFSIGDKSNASQIFTVRDFVGDACKTIASKVRGAVAMESFDNFHKHSARIIRSAVIGIDAGTGKVRELLEFPANGLMVSNVDIQTVEPIDVETRQSLQHSVQMAITITTNSQEARARHDAHREEEEAKGLLEQQRLKNEAAAEKSRRLLLELKAESQAIETSGQAKAEARARAEASLIDCQGNLEKAQLAAQAARIEAQAAMEQEIAEREAEYLHAQRMDALEIEKAQKLAEIQQKTFKNTVEALGADTITAIARAGPEMQAKLLQGLGLNTMLLTDGKSPINLFNTANGLVGVTSGVGQM